MRKVLAIPPLLTLLFIDAASADTLTGRVVRVIDGDTVVLLDGHQTAYRIRLAGIDAPERAQAYGQRAKASLSELVFGKTVAAECPKDDRYGRRLCKLLVDGQDANLEQVRRGMAWWYRQYAREQRASDRESYRAAELSAQRGGMGLWSERHQPVPPWDFRVTPRFSPTNHQAGGLGLWPLAESDSCPMTAVRAIPARNAPNVGI